MDYNWTSDNYKFVGKAFERAYKDQLNTLLPIIGEETANSADFELTGTGGFGEAPAYDGYNLNVGTDRRAFKTIITPKEYLLMIPVQYKRWKIDKMGETHKVGTRLGSSMAGTVFVHTLRMFENAWNADGQHNGGDGKPWAAVDHPVGSKSSNGRSYVADPDMGVYSNILNQALSVSAITKAQSMARRFKTPDGMPFICQMDTVLVSPELEEKAKRMFGENAKLDPESGNNGANPVAGMRYIVMGGGEEGFTKNQWAVCDRRLMKEIVNIVYITKPEVTHSKSDNPYVDNYTGYTDFGVGWGDARQIIFGDPS